MECRNVLATFALPAIADGLVADRNLDAVYDDLVTDGTAISNRWFQGVTAPIGQERGVFEFDLSSVPAGSPLSAARFEFYVVSFTSSSQDGITTYPTLQLQAYAGDGAVTLADGGAAATAVGSGQVTATQSGQIALDPAALQSLLGGHATIRVQNTARDANWASLSSLENQFGVRARLVLEVAEQGLNLSVSSGAFSEATGASAAQGTVTRTGNLSAPLTVILTSNDASELTVPRAVTIPANESSATFPVAAVDDFFRDGDQLATISATAEVPGTAPSIVLDSSFGVDGLAATDLLMRNQFPTVVMERLPDGRILAASELSDTEWQLTRLLENGQIDRSFGNNGVVTTVIYSWSSNRPQPLAIAVQPDGKYLVGGRLSGGPAQGILGRYNEDGSLDGSFGAIATDNLTSRLPDAWVTDIAVRPGTGQILLGLGENGTVRGRVAQLRSDGTFDSAFGSTGIRALNDISSFGLSAVQVELLADGTFLAAGSVSASARVARVAANGNALAAFGAGGSGIASLDFGASSVRLSELKFDNLGRILYGANVVPTGTGQDDFAVARLNADGTLDTTFAEDGTAVLVSGGGSEIATSLVVQDDNKIVLGGVSIVSGAYDSALARFDSDGTPDSSFDGDGLYRQSLLSTYAADIIFDLALQPQGELLALIGWGDDLRVARLNILPPPDTLNATAEVTILDDEPLAQALDYTTDEDTTVESVVIARDPDNDLLTYTVIDEPLAGTVELNPETGAFTYTPHQDFYGTDSFTYQVTDGPGVSNLATATIHLRPVNDTPVASPQYALVQEDMELSSYVQGFDVDADHLGFQLVDGPAHGTVTVDLDGDFVYRPAANYHGLDSFTFLTNDGTVDSAPATVTIEVRPGNDVPVAHALDVSLDEDQSVTGRVAGNDFDGDALRFLIVEAPQHGTFTFSSESGEFIYSPDPNFVGTDSFTFKANDSAVDSNTATVSLTVQGVNDAPTLESDTFSLAENSTNNTVVGQVTASDVDGDQSVTYAIVGGNTGNAFAIDPATGEITVLNSAALDFESTPQFSLIVQASDNGTPALDTTAAVTIQLTDVAEPILIGVDVKPHDGANQIVIPKEKQVQLALLSNSSFDARTINLETLRIGRNGTEDSVARNKKGRLLYSFSDVDGDGRLDLVVTFDVARSGLQVGDTLVKISATTNAGQVMMGSGAVTVVKKGR